MINFVVMKTLLKIISLAIVVAPCLLVCNDSDTFVPNLIGISYTIFLAYLSITPMGVFVYKWYYRFIIELNEKIEKWLMK